ncbi:MAG: hypothetical protein CL917_14225 [Deltaproteobacteria bacterium]|nr:hypothetical protein [Deltaproteobacteria bacterium]
MGTLRYVKKLEQVKRAAEQNPEFLESEVTSIRCVYETDPGLAQLLLPKPLEIGDRPLIHVTFSKVAMHISPEYVFEIGSAIFGVRAQYDGKQGTYLITMPMTTEQAVVPGRETFGEPKKIADISLTEEEGRLSAQVNRMGVTYLEARGHRGEALEPKEFVEHAFCFKASPSCEKSGTFDAEPLLVRLDWHQRQSKRCAIEAGELILRESAADPVADLPVREILSMEYEVGTTESNGQVLRSIPGDWLLPFLHQRYDDMSGEGIEL